MATGGHLKNEKKNCIESTVMIFNNKVVDLYKIEIYKKNKK